MKIFIKMVLTVFWFLEILYFFTFLSVDFFKWFNKNIVSFEHQNLIMNLIHLILIVIILIRIWSFKEIEKSKKVNNTLLIIFLSLFYVPIYLWKIDTENENTISLYKNV